MARGAGICRWGVNWSGATGGTMDVVMLVALDEAAFADGALEVALKLAARAKRITVVGLHVINVVSAGANASAAAWLGAEPSPVPPEVAAWHEARAQVLGQRFLAACAAHDLPCQLRVEVGAWAERVLFHGHAADLVVLARASHAEDEERALGEGESLVPDVLSGLRGAALVVPPGAPELQRLVLGWGPSPTAQRTLKAAGRLARAAALPLSVVIVSEGSSEDEQRPLRQQLEAIALPAEIHVIPGEVWEALTAFSSGGAPAIVAVGASDKSRLGRWIWGSTPDSLLDSTDLSVLVVG